MEKLPSFFKKEMRDNKDQVVFIGSGNLEIYIPYSYIENEYAVTTGNILKTFAVFCFKYDNKTYKFNLPIAIDIEFSDRRTEKGVSIFNGAPKEDYGVFILKPGDAFCANTSHTRGLNDTDFFIDKILYAGKFPSFLTYNEIYETVMALLRFAGGDYNTPSTSFEILVSEICRDRSNANKSFRFSTNPMKHPYGYKTISIKKIPEKQSVFNGFIGEDFKHQIISAILRTRQGEEDIESPMESLFKL